MTKVTRCVLLDNHRLELYWDGSVTGSCLPENLTVSSHGGICHLHDWKEKEEWDKGCVYEPERRRTTLYVEENLYPYDAGSFRITFSDAVRGADGLPVEKEVSGAEYLPYYEKYTASKCGIVVKSSAQVSDEAHRIAIQTADHMLSRMPDVAAVMRSFHAQIAIYGLEESAYSIPEHRAGYRVATRPVEGYGGEADLPVTSVSECNLLRIKTGPHATGYQNEFILAHEFGHAVHLIGLNYLKDQTKARQLLRIYENSRGKGLWPKTYAISNCGEYFATLTTIWFNAMSESADGSWDGVRGPINKRDELREYDPEAYAFFAGIYPQEGFAGVWSETPRRFSAGKMGFLKKEKSNGA